MRRTSLFAAALLAASAFGWTAHAGPPANPRVVDFEARGKTIGKRGGQLKMLMAKSKDISQMIVYSGARLVTYDENFELVPDILEKVEVEANRIFTFTLREGHLWSDGEPFTTEDFRYYWEDVANNAQLEPGGPERQLLVDGQPPRFEVLDARTVRYSWDKPNPLFLTAVAGARPLYIYMPAHYMKQFHERYADKARLASLVQSENVQGWTNLHQRFGRQYRPENPAMPSLQPWQNTTQTPSERYVFKRNPNFHRVDPEGTQLPYLDEVILNIASSDIIPAKTGAGESDLQARYLAFSDYTFLKQGAEGNGYEVRLWPQAKGSEMVLLPNLNSKDPAWAKTFQNADVRRALSLAIDRADINETIFFGLATPAANSVLEGSPLYEEEYALAYAQYDPDRANELLDAAGLERGSDGTRRLPNGAPMEIIVETAGFPAIDTDVLQLVAENWKAIGVKLFVKPSQRDILRRRVGNGETVMSVWQGLDRGLATADMDPEELAPVSSLQGQWPDYGRYVETKGVAGTKPEGAVGQLSSLYEQWRGATEPARQREIWKEMLGIYTDQVFTIGIVSGSLQPVVVSNRLKNVPDEGVWSFQPTSYFGHYLPDTFYLAQ